MGAINDIRDRLAARHPDWHVGVEGQAIRVKAPVPDGFDVWLQEAGGTFIVGYGNGWHEHFTSEEEALACFAFGFSDQCRLKIARRGRHEYKWTVEAMKDGEWVADSSIGTIPFLFWLPCRVEYRQNAVLKGR